MKEKILGILLFILLATIWLGGLAYIVSAGNCQNDAKRDHTFTSQTSIDCMDWRNWK